VLLVVYTSILDTLLLRTYFSIFIAFFHFMAVDGMFILFSHVMLKYLTPNEKSGLVLILTKVLFLVFNKRKICKKKRYLHYCTHWLMSPVISCNDTRCLSILRCGLWILGSELILFNAKSTSPSFVKTSPNIDRFLFCFDRVFGLRLRLVSRSNMSCPVYDIVHIFSQILQGYVGWVSSCFVQIPKKHLVRSG